MAKNVLTQLNFRTRLIVMMLALLLVTGVVTFYFNYRAEQQIEAQVNADFETLGQAFDIAATSLTSKEDMDEIAHGRPIESQFTSHRIHILILDGREVYDSSDSNLIHKPLPIGFEADDQNAGGVTSPEFANTIAEFIGESTSVPSNQRHTFSFPVYTSKGTYHLVIVMANPYLSQTIRGTAYQRLAITIAIFCVAILLTAVLAYNFTKPIVAVSRAAERVAAGDLDSNVPVDRNDEIGELALTFNHMIERLRNQRELEERLSQSEQSAIVGRLASGIAHEIRNPLNYINLSIDHVRSKFQPTDEKARQQFVSLLTTVKEEILRLNRIVTDFLNYGRPVKLSPKTINVRSLVEDTVRLVQQKAHDQGITITVDEGPAVSDIRGDPEQLKSCFSNIIINGVQAMEFGGQMDIRIINDEKGVLVKIKDSGTGIPADALDRIFEPYYSTKETGIGLGLAVTKRIIEQHRGIISVSSAAGEGTEFSILLPNSLQTGDLGVSGVSGFEGGRATPVSR